MSKIGVCLVTFNEVEYISQAIDSVLSQKCSAEVIVYIGDDHSEDGTELICKNYAELYPDRIVLIRQETNIGLVSNTQSLLERINYDGCEYVAMLDGDDFWCDDLKLQKEVDYLEAHENYGLIHSGVKLLFPNGMTKTILKEEVPTGDVWKHIGKLSISNCTVMFRTSLLQYCDFDAYKANNFSSVDFTMYASFARYAMFQYLPEITAVWRRGHASISGGGKIDKQIRYIDNDVNQWRYLSTIFPEKWQFTKQSGEQYKRNRGFIIAYKYGDFKYANEYVKAGVSLGNRGLKYKVMIFAARYKPLFNLLYFVHWKKREPTIS